MVVPWLMATTSSPLAEAVYREDLRHHPENRWSLHGLAECLRREGNAVEAAAVAPRLDAAWRHATVRLTASCCCRKL